jgi:hypothetical protein
MRDVRLLPEVVADVAAAMRWYDEQGCAGLGERFLAAFDSSVLHIRQRGDVYRTVYRDFRKVLLRPFPYLLFYTYHGDTLVVSLVIHGARNPVGMRSLLRSRRP